MNKLFTANVFHLKKSREFWVVALAMFGFAAFVMLHYGLEAKRIGPADISLNQRLFNTLPIVPLFYAVFISLFLGTDYSDGTIRNKLVVGHTRTDIYLSSFAASFLGVSAIFVAFVLGGFAGIPLLGGWQNGYQSLFVYILVCVFGAAALTAIFTFLSMLSSNKATTAVAAIILGLMLMLVAAIIYGSLCEPEFSSSMILTAGGVQAGEPVLNPSYVSGLRRRVYEWLMEILPTGQAILIANEEAGHPVINIISSGIITVAVTICGIFAFRKKDLR